VADSALRQQLQTALAPMYQIERELAGGGMSRVFLAEEARFRRKVVVKVLAPELAAELSAQRFERELELAAGLQQANIVPVLTAGDVGGIPWYTMPFVEGESLRARMARGTLPTREAVKILADVARALAYAHAHGIVHRDVKPENVLLSSGTAVVTDFGIAKALAASKTDAGSGASGATLTQSGTALGTPAYMAPEQAAGDDVDARADLYAWGVMAYELLSGRHPFAGSTSPQQLMAAHFAETPASLSSTRVGERTVPRAIAALVARCLAKDRASRPASATEIVATLEEASGTAAKLALPRRMVVASIAAAVIVIAIVASMAWRRYATTSDTQVNVLPLVAVLPFETSSGGTGAMVDSSFADGLEDAITGKLSRLAGLRVIDRSSVRSIEHAAANPLRTGAALGASYVLRATVRWARGPDGAAQVRVSPVLVRVSDGTTRWAGEPTVVSPADPFAVEGMIATDVAEALDVVLAPAERLGLVTPSTRDTAAYAAVERGRRILQDGQGPSIDRLRRALAEFQFAYQRDPQDADALAEAADAMQMLAQRGQAPALRDSASVLARRALALDAGQVHAVNAISSMEKFHGRYAASRALVERAVQAHPSSAELLMQQGVSAQVSGDSAVAWRSATAALELGPRSERVIRGGIQIAIALRRYEDARDLIAKERALSQSARPASWAAALSAAVGDSLGVVRAVGEMRARGERDVYEYMSRGDKSLADELLAASPADFDARTALDTVSIYAWQSEVYLRRGDSPRARAVGERARRVIRSSITLAAATPSFDTWRLAQSYALLAWFEAAGGDSVSARVALAKSAAAPIITGMPGGAADAWRTCMVARVEGLLGNVEAMLPPLRRCLTMPNGLPVVRLTQESEFTRHRNDPRVRGLAASLVQVRALERPTQ
jgi:serine/threonine-protein kinase